MALEICEDCGERYCRSCGYTVEDAACELCDLFGTHSTEEEHQCTAPKPVAEVVLPLIPGDTGKDGPVELDVIQTKVDAARTLERAGWSVRAAPQGLHCCPPDGVTFTFDQVTAMGIPKGLIVAGIYPGSNFRSPAEIHEATEKLWTQYWYERHGREVNLWPNEQERLETGRILRRFEEKYGREELLVEGDYELGKMRGKLSALIWLRGYDWDLKDFGIDDGPYGMGFPPM